MQVICVLPSTTRLKMKLLLVTLFSIAVVAADGQDFHNVPGETSQLLPDETEVQVGVEGEQNILGGRVIFVPATQLGENQTLSERSDLALEDQQVKLLPDETEVQGGVEGEQNILGGRVIFVPATQLGENQTLSARSDLALEDQQVKVDDMEILLGRSKWCKRRGGRCTRPNKFSCNKHWYKESPKGRPYCTSKKRRCCYPVRECPKGDGFFTVPGTKQCFKYFTDKALSWEESQSKCQNESLVLAIPDEPLVVRKHLVAHFGNTEAWIDARGTGSSINWVRDGTMISNSSSLWWGGSPRNTSTSYCLLLLNTQGEMEARPTRPYYMYPCSGGWQGSGGWQALCELVMD